MSDLLEPLRVALKEGEGERVEFKRAFDEQARQTLCAFANTVGGELWVGVADDGSELVNQTPRTALRPG